MEVFSLPPMLSEAFPGHLTESQIWERWTHVLRMLLSGLLLTWPAELTYVLQAHVAPGLTYWITAERLLLRSSLEPGLLSRQPQKRAFHDS